MPEITILDRGEIDYALEQVRHIPHGLQRAIFPAVYDVLQGAKKQLLESLESDVPMPHKYIHKAIRINPPRLAGKLGVSGSVTVRSPQIPLIEYDVQPKEITSRQGVRVKERPDFSFSIRRGQRATGRSWIQDNAVSPNFIAQVVNREGSRKVRAVLSGRFEHQKKGPQSGIGKLGVYYRTGSQTISGKAELKPVYGPSVQYHVARPEVESAVYIQAGEQFPQILARYVEQALKKYNAGKYSVGGY